MVTKKLDGIVKTKVRPFGTGSAYVTLPVKWVGCRVLVVNLDDEAIEKE